MVDAKPSEERVRQHIILVGCTRRKLRRSAPAGDLYASEWFQIAKTVARRFGNHWYVLSAKHGLLEPTAEIEPYDLALSDQHDDYRSKWAWSIVQSLQNSVPRSAQITLLAEADYTTPLIPALENYGYVVIDPLRNRPRDSQKAWLTQRARPQQLGHDLDKLYVLFDALRSVDGAPRLAECTGSMEWPERGVYFFFEDGQSRWTSATQRVIRVGTHAVSQGSKSSLWNRLRTHRGGVDKSGNHRGSIFRLHVGAAIIARGGGRGQPASWGKGQAAPTEIRKAEEDLERQVSDYLGSLRVMWIEVADEPSPSSDRGYIEQNVIGLLTPPAGPLDPPTTDWLGLRSPQDRIRSSGLWNLDYVGRPYDTGVLEVLRFYIDARIRRRSPGPSSVAPSGWNIRHADRRQINLLPEI